MVNDIGILRALLRKEFDVRTARLVHVDRSGRVCSRKAAIILAPVNAGRSSTVIPLEVLQHRLEAAVRLLKRVIGRSYEVTLEPNARMSWAPFLRIRERANPENGERLLFLKRKPQRVWAP